MFFHMLQILAHVPPMQRERVAQVLMAPGYLRKLLDLFRVSSAFGDHAGQVVWAAAVAVQYQSV